MTRNFSLAVAQAVKILRKNQLAQLMIVIVVAVASTSFFVLLSEHTANARQFQTFGDAVWWSIVTISTVGYGDKVPITTAGRIVSTDHHRERAHTHFTLYRDNIIGFRREKN